ncbi:hypothetical protein [Nocardia otitidiscaviarum]|uniref:hypothetical protein n=1 Tax=Nocardia otitidiscaviarum TaxID=1823 RepID=UPI0018961654|nr:hypothetical protein [Nocardia otitidiscaviarum]MBF6179811.1 hypothetical protein [Nocardia otitidiscaviarum]MBF6235589.1 hypothetical protein [Nocardia otitidiscaviarum]
MRFRPTAIGYLRSDISGLRQAWDESQIRSLAARRGFDFAKMIVLDGRTGKPPLAALKSTITRISASAVFVPSTAHFDGDTVPPALLNVVSVITIDPDNTYPRSDAAPRR